MDYTAECFDKFQSLPTNIKNKLSVGKYYKRLKEIEQKYQISLAFVVILLAVGELDESDLSEYLRLKFALTIKKSKELSDVIFKDVMLPAIEESILITKTATSFLSDNQIEDILKSNFISFITGNKMQIVHFNKSAFLAMDRDELLEDRLINIFLNNEEVLSKNNLVIDNKSYKGTIKNWLKHFVHTNGSDLFDSFVLAKYLNSDSVNNLLNEEEKNILSIILKTYRNLVFFPESMNHVPIEDWVIIPVDHLENEAKDKMQDVKKIKIKTLDENKIINKNDVPVSAAHDKQYQALADILQNYEPTSLEYKAIKEEMNRLRQ